jgi:hypothetical protein
VGYLGMGFEAPTEERPQGDGGIWDGNFEGIDLLAEGFNKDLGGDLGQDTLFGGWDWAADPVELEVSQEEGPITMEPSPSTSTLPQSSSTNNDMTSSTSPETQGSNKHASLSSNDTPSSDEWSCDFANCGKRFSHRHKLKYVSLPPVNFSVLADHTKPPQEIPSETLSLS